MGPRCGRVVAGALIAVWAAIPAPAQSMGDLSGASTTRREALLTYAPDPTTVAAGKRTVVEVRLRIADGFHINSHRPKSDLLIATAATLEPQDAGVSVGAVEYPPGTSYHFATDPGEVLDVYTGTLVLRVPVTAKAGDHELHGSVKYQACDDRACYPPKSLAMVVPFTAK